MKKILLLFLFAVLLGSNINAQDDEASLFVWGARLGMNWATIRGDFDEGLEARTSGVIGIFTRLKLNSSFYVQPEVNYVLKGASRRITLLIGQSNQVLDYRLGFDYIEVPALLKYNFGSEPTDGFKPEIFLGPFVAFNLSSSIEVKDVPNSEFSIENVKSSDYGIAFGTGINFSVEYIDVILELRYTLSLSSFDDNIDQADLRNGKLGVFSITTGFAVN